MLKIVADARERQCGIPDLLIRMGMDVRIKRLQTGDYQLDGGIVVERKTVSDMISSIEDGRFIAQCTRLENEFKKSFIILEGSDKDMQRLEDEPTKIYHALATAVFNHGINIISTPSTTHTARLLKELHYITTAPQ